MIKDDLLPKLVRDEVRDKMTLLGTEISTKQNQFQVELLKKVPCLITLEKIVSYLIFSSPKQKAQGELIVWDLSWHTSVRLCVHTFKHVYL